MRSVGCRDTTKWRKIQISREKFPKLNSTWKHLHVCTVKLIYQIVIMYNIFKCTPVTDVFLAHFWAFAPEPQRLHQYKQLPGIYKHQITVTEKSTFIVHTGPCLCLALGLWSAPLRLLRRSLRVLHTKHPLQETLCLIYGFETLF